MTNDVPITRRRWAAMLGSVCSPSFPADAVEAITDMLPLLAEWGGEYFTLKTIQEVGTMKRRQSCPSLDEITVIFVKHRLENMPIHVRMGAATAPAIPAPNSREPTAADIEYVARRVQEAKAILIAVTAKRDAVKGHGQQPPRARHLTPLELALSARANGAVVLAGSPRQRIAAEYDARTKGTDR